MPDKMTEQEFRNEIRRGIVTIIRACVRYFAMSWTDFLPREERPAVITVEGAPAGAPVTTTTLPGVVVKAGA